MSINQTGDYMDFNIPKLSKSVLLCHQHMYEFDGHNIHMNHKNWSKIKWQTPYVEPTYNNYYCRMWILVEDKLINAPVIIS